MRNDKHEEKVFSPSWGWLGIILTGALGLYLFSLPQFYVGFFNDDAAYILAARSLLQGHFLMLQTPGLPPMHHFLPGYPLFLMPFVAWAAPQWILLKGTTVLVTLLSVFVLWSLLRTWKSPWTCLIAVALFAFNPTVGFYSGAVMSDPFFLLLILLSLFIMGRVLESESVGGSLILGLLMGWCAITRPVGALLIPCVCMGLLWERRLRKVWPALVLALLIWGVVFVRNYEVSRTPTDYVSYLKGSLIYLSVEGRLSSHVRQVTSALWATLLPLPEIFTRYRFVHAITLGSATGLAVLGYKRFTEKITVRPGVLLASGLLCLGYFLVLSLWMAEDSRYFLVLMPFILTFLIEGGRTLIDRLPFPRVAAAIGLAPLVIGCAVVNETALRAAWSVSRPPQAQFPRATLTWVNQHCPSDAVFLGRPSLIYLYTGRQGYGGLNVRDIDDFRYRLLREPGVLIFVQPERVNSVQGVGAGFRDQALMMERAGRWAGGWPQAFRCIYANSAEGTRIYNVVPDKTFTQAYAWLIEARRQFASASPRRGFSALDRALALDPRLVSALVAYGQAILAEGGDWHQAEQKLKRALQIRPQDPAALLTLSQISASVGHHDLAGR